FGLNCTFLSRLNVSQGVTPRKNSCQKRGCGLCLAIGYLSNNFLNKRNFSSAGQRIAKKRREEKPAKSL
ncbi:MAG: hypothetical protein VYD12_05315, partial [Pseudomonadota bacterium]|nr:hypothetical protein [Pseudomonadota bacterium]